MNYSEDYYSLNKMLTNKPVNKEEIGIGTAHSKIILMGEHAVVYDHPAIALPFPAANTKVTITPSDSHESYIQSRYFNGKLAEVPTELDNLKEAIKVTSTSLNLKAKPLNILIESTIPSGRGMGSSAAVTVALVRSLCDFYDCELPDYLLQFIVNQAEVIAHESTSGLDTLITSSMQAVIYKKSQQPHPFSFGLDAYLVVADSNQEGHTKQAVGKVRQLKESQPDFINSVLEAIGTFVYQAMDAIRNKNIQELGRLMTYNHYYLNQLEVSNSRLDQIVNAAWLAGALGAKLTGGGMGGCVIALAQTAQEAQAVEDAMKAAGAIQTWQLDLKSI